MNNRPLHWCLKISDRRSSHNFYSKIFGMKVFRHEEFNKGCEATCNGPYDNGWSKTMMGYGDENKSFSLELTYNYPIKSYDVGNDLVSITLLSTRTIKNLNGINYAHKITADGIEIKDPDGYKFILKPGNDTLSEVCLNVSNLKNSLEYWNGILGLDIVHQEDKIALLGLSNQEWKLKLVDIGEKIDHKTGWGRIAFAAPINAVRAIEKRMNDEKRAILHPLRELETPGKPTVTVVILLDPDGYEICYVGAEDFDMLSAIDSKAESLLEEEISKDRSNK